MAKCPSNKYLPGFRVNVIEIKICTGGTLEIQNFNILSSLLPNLSYNKFTEQKFELLYLVKICMEKFFKFITFEWH
jgi:hypothetical protein